LEWLAFVSGNELTDFSSSEIGHLLSGRDRRLEKLHNEKLHNLYALQNIIKMVRSRKEDEMLGHVCSMYGRGKKCKVLLGKPMHRWENNIQMDLKETGCEGVNWNHCI
jgi:hypothetical protein